MGAVLRYPQLASESSVTKACKEQLGPLIRQTRRERQLLHAQWTRYDNLGKSRHDSDSYHGRLRAFLSIGHRVIENWVTKLKADLFPDSGKWFRILSEERDSDDGVEVLTALFRRLLWDHMRVRRKAGPILRDLVTLGTKPLDIGWRYSARDVPTLQRVWDQSGQNPKKAIEVIKKIVEYVGPTLRDVDLFRWYVYPTSVNDLADTTCIFEDILLPMDEVERLGRTPIHPGDLDLGMQFVHVDQARALLPTGVGSHSTKDDLAKFQAERARLAARGLHSPVDTSEDPNQLLTCTKSFWRASLVDTTEDGTAHPEVPQWYQVVTTGDEDIVLQARQVVFWDGEPSYLAPKFVEVCEEFYGYGLPGVFDSLHYMTNDILNQGGDCLTFSLNPIAGVDPGAVQDMTTIRMRPGAKWLIRKPRENMMFVEPPKEAAQAAMGAVEQLIALINDVANVAPFGGAGLTGPRARGRALNTAGGMQIIASENLVQVHDVIQGLEDLWFDPMLRKMYSRISQCLDVPVLLNIEGAAGAAMVQKEVTREDLIGAFSFRWQASVSSFNLQVRAQQMIAFAQIMARIPPQLLQAENVRFSWKYFLKTLWGEGFQLPEGDRLLVDGTPVKALDPHLENELFQVGRGDDVHVSPADKDLDHLKLHESLLAPGELHPELQPPVVAHMQEHLTAMLTKQAMASQPQGAMDPMSMLGGMMGGNPSGQGAMPDAPGRVSATNDMGDVMRRMDRQPGGMTANGDVGSTDGQGGMG